MTVKEHPLTKEFEFLVNLRDSGITNMWGAVPYLQQEFGCTKEEGKTILFTWMKSFKE